MTEVGARVVRFDKTTNQPAKAQEWQDKLSTIAASRTAQAAG